MSKQYMKVFCPFLSWSEYYFSDRFYLLLLFVFEFIDFILRVMPDP